MSSIRELAARSSSALTAAMIVRAFCHFYVLMFRRAGCPMARACSQRMGLKRRLRQVVGRTTSFRRRARTAIALEIKDNVTSPTSRSASAENWDCANSTI